jgi:uncharacterized phage protein (TIGR02218 family)
VTIRSGYQAQQNQKWRRAQTLCTLFRVTRTDGVILRFTDHDRTVTLDGYEYFPAALASITAERRESDLRASNQEARGIVDGTTILIPDLLGNKYRGAKVEQFLVDWRRPWVWHYKATKRIRMMSYDGSGWIATLEGLTSQLQQPVGGRFGGTHSQQCTYTLADQDTCRADIADDLIYDPTTFTVDFTSTSAILIGTAGAPWTTNQWAGYYFHLRQGSERGKERRIVSNTTNVLRLEEALDTIPVALPAVTVTGWIGRGPAVDTIVSQRMEFTLSAASFPTAGSYTDNFFRDGEIEWMTGNNVGAVSPIIEYDSATRTVRLLLPTPFDIQSGDRGIVRPGCDGLIGTCISKFRQAAAREGTVAALSTTTVVQDTAGGMTVNEYQNGYYKLKMLTGTAAGEERDIASNTATTFTVTTAFSVAPSSSSQYRVVKSNVDNFGGTDVYSPGANKTIEQLDQ